MLIRFAEFSCWYFAVDFKFYQITCG